MPAFLQALSFSYSLSLSLSLCRHFSRARFIAPRWRAPSSIQRLTDAISADVGGESNASEGQEKWN